MVQASNSQANWGCEEIHCNLFAVTRALLQSEISCAVFKAIEPRNLSGLVNMLMLRVAWHPKKSPLAFLTSWEKWIDGKVATLEGCGVWGVRCGKVFGLFQV